MFGKIKNKIKISLPSFFLSPYRREHGSGLKIVFFFFKLFSTNKRNLLSGLHLLWLQTRLTMT